MTREQVFTELQQIFQDVFVDDTIVLRPEMTANDISKWDSMQQINIIMACEEAFKVRFKPERSMPWKTSARWWITSWQPCAPLAGPDFECFSAILHSSLASFRRRC